MAFRTPGRNPRTAGRLSNETRNPGLQPSFQISPSMATHASLRTMASDSSLRPSRLDRLLRRGRPVPPPIAVPHFKCDESPPPTAVPTPPPSHLPSPLLAGCPGREISGAKSDGREWAYDFDSPPVLVYPDDLSKTTFHEHPLARELQWEKGWETQQLALYGLILPEKIDNGTPTYTWDSDEEEEGVSKAVVLAMPPKTPPPTMASRPSTAVERPRTPSNIMHKVKTFANFVANSDMEKEVPELPTLKELLDQFGMPPETPTEATPRSFLRPTKSSGCLRPKTPIRSVPSATKLRNKRSEGIEKSKISDPVAPEEMRRVGNNFSNAASRKRTASESRRLSSHAVPLCSPSNLISSSASSNMPLFLLQPQHPTVYFGTNEPPPQFRLARPRLAPMEHARQYLIAKSRANREGGECTVPKPGLTWCWSENYKEFFLLPSIPNGVARNFLPDEEEADPIWKKKKRPIASFMDKDDQAAKRRSFIPLPLNLAPSSPLLPAHLRHSSQSSILSSPSQYDSSLDNFSLGQPILSPSDHSPLIPAKTTVTDPSATASHASPDFFASVHRGSGREFSSSFPPHLLSASSTSSRSIRQQAPQPVSERHASASRPPDTFPGSLTGPQVDREHLPFESASDKAPADITHTPVISTQRTFVAAVSSSKKAWDMSVTHLEQARSNNTRGEVLAMQRPDSALSSCTVIRSCSPTSSNGRDEDDVAPKSVDCQCSDLPPTPISPPNNSPQSPATDVFAPLQDTRALDTLDDAQTQQPSTETVLRSIVDDVGDAADFPDSSSVYSQDSIVTAVHHPLTDCRRALLDFMSQRQSATESEEETLTPRHLSELSSAEAQLQARTVQPSPVLRPVSYIPDTETAKNYSSSETSLEYQNNRCSQASTSTLTIDSQPSRHLGAAHDALSPKTFESRMDADIRRFRALERQNMSERGENAFVGAGRRRFDGMQVRCKPRSAQSAAQVDTHAHAHETASIESVASSSTSQNDRYSTASDAPSITSASTAESRRSQALSVTSAASSDRSTSSKRARRPRVEATSPDTGTIALHNTARDATRFPLHSVMESPAPSAGLRTSVTSPVVAAADRSRKSLLPNSRQPVQQKSKISEELPSLKVRRRRAVANLAHIPVSQAYPQPLRLSTMKSPPPRPDTTGAQCGDGAVAVARSTSRIITDIGDELNREMDDVLSPHSADLAFRSESTDQSDIETPTRRPLRQVRSMKSMGFDTPRLPAPNKPLPSLPSQTARVEAQRGVAANAFIDIDFGPVVSTRQPRAGLPPQPAPPPTAPLPRPPIPLAVPVVPSEPSSASASGFGSTYVTRADFSVKKDRTVRPAASMAAFSYRPTPMSADQPQPQRQVQRLDSEADLQKPGRTRLLGKMVSMGELKHRREMGSAGSGEDAVGMRTFLGEDDDIPAVPSAKEKTESVSKKKFFGGLFRRKGKDGQK
ncbi:hypothetical protein CMUS01_04128 [Colletotrichum musicola]|uniref:Uncharacterized protein n=1 Tax=Colletotrichum musicola TaxID=2175873 RepID=A0A8H6NNW5_9PEZI|nr:hypothetical protein CMUS01_04128 [Colletotrichum musicola]